MTVFEKLRYKNILSTGDTFMEIDLNTIDLTLIIGKNGGGKTTLIDALYFCLYGKPFRDINKDMLINSINGKKLLTECEFRNGPNAYKVVRGIKPNLLEFYVNGVLLPKDAKVVDYQKHIQKALGLGEKSFRSQAVLGSRTYVPFMRLKTEDRRAVIEDLLDLEVFTIMNKVNKENLAMTEQDMGEIDRELRTVGGKLELEKTRISLVRGNIDESVDRLERKINALEAQQSATSSDRNRVEEEIADLIPQTKAGKELNDTFGKYNSARNRLEGQVYTCEQTIGFYETNDKCSKCLQDISPDFKAEIVGRERSSIEILEERIGKAQTLISDLSLEIARIGTIERKITELQTTVAVYRSTMRSLSQQIDACHREIADLKKPTANFDEIENTIARWQAEYTKAMDSKNDLATKIDYYKAAGLILKDNGIKARIIKQYIPVMNTLINKYLGIMGFNVAFEIDETFSETIKSQYKEAFSYGSFSEGEKMRLDLAIMFAWRDVAKLRNTTATNLLVMDEVLDASLDTEGAEDFLSIVKKMAADTNTIIISHKSEQLMDKFSKVISFIKVKKFAKMKVVK